MAVSGLVLRNNQKVVVFSLKYKHHTIGCHARMRRLRRTLPINSYTMLVDGAFGVFRLT